MIPPPADITDKRIIRTYWLPESQSVLLHTADRSFIEIRVHRLYQNGDGKTPRIFEIANGEHLQDCEVEEFENLKGKLITSDGPVAYNRMTIHTNRGLCVIVAVMDKVTDDNEVVFAMEEYIGYPPETATTLSSVRDGVNHQGEPNAKENLH